MTNGTQPTFEIGLAMAGAISAGAYSAGVMDFLVEALDEWDKVRGQPGIPDHRVVIKVLSGASAGAITGALGTVTLAGGLQPRTIDAIKSSKKLRAVLPGLYRTWVEEPRFVSEDGLDLLSTEDLEPDEKGEKKAVSVLNSRLLDLIRKNAFKISKPPNPRLLPYLAKDLHIYLTVTNLRGIPYTEGFSGGPYGMQTHGDRMHYTIQGLGGADTPSEWARKDKGATLHVDGLFGEKTADDWEAFGLSAVASGAFPIGLAPRLLQGTTDDYDDRYMPIDIPTHVEVKPGEAPKKITARVKPSWPKPWFDGAKGKFPFLTVDGGLINNEPFEYARFSLMKNPPEPNPREGALADRAVVMIDPFPEPPDFLPDGKPTADIVSVASALFPALVNQARFKPAELLDAANNSVFSRFLIAPSRHSSKTPDAKEELHAIACGVLGGFGGFLDEAYRQHDFQLGRRNCQRFLRQVFALPGDNDIIKSWPADARADIQYQTKPDKAVDPVNYCIIPLVGTAKDENELLDWPRMSQADFEILQTRVKQRVKKLVPILIQSQSKSRLIRGALYVAAFFTQTSLLEYVRHAILSDVVRRDLIEGWSLPPLPSGITAQNVRDVLSELALPAFNYRTPARLAEATHQDRSKIDKILVLMKQQDGMPYLVWQTAHPKTGEPIYTLYSRKPSVAWSIPIIKEIGNFANAPVID